MHFFISVISPEGYWEEFWGTHTFTISEYLTFLLYEIFWNGHTTFGKSLGEEEVVFLVFTGAAPAVDWFKLYDGSTTLSE